MVYFLRFNNRMENILLVVTGTLFYAKICIYYLCNALLVLSLLLLLMCSSDQISVVKSIFYYFGKYILGLLCLYA